MGAPVTTDELRAAWKAAGLWRIGMSFEKAQHIATIRWAMEHAALAKRKREHLPEQPRLI